MSNVIVNFSHLLWMALRRHLGKGGAVGLFLGPTSFQVILGLRILQQ